MKFRPSTTMKPTSVLLYVIFLWNYFGLLCPGLGVADCMEYMGQRNQHGVQLSEMILKFSEYDYREDKDRGIRVIVTGCVRCPGVYLISNKDALGPLLMKAHTISIKEHTAHSYMRGIRVFRRGTKAIFVDTFNNDGKLVQLKDGDVINVLAVVL